MDKAVIPLIETRAVSRRFGERRQGWLDRQLQARGWSRRRPSPTRWTRST
jgi:peptide/nickel transport system ATP-binding protein